MGTEVELVEPLRQLRATLEETERDLSAMPFFVRPMVRLGFAGRTGLSMDAWHALTTRLLGAAPGGVARVLELRPDLPSLLDRLAEHYRTAPERAERGMRADAEALRRVRESSQRREDVVRRLRRLF